MIPKEITSFQPASCFCSCCLILLVTLFLPSGINAQILHPSEGEETINYFIKLIKDNEPVIIPVSGIYSKNDILFCEGDSAAAKANNAAAELMLNGEYETAIISLLKSIPKAALFLPFQYNAGICYYHLNDRRRARLHLNKALMIVPEYFLTDIQLGNLEQLEGKDELAIRHYRNALQKNRKHLDALVLVGNIYFKRRQMEMASRYYETVLSINPLFPNALLGRAKILFSREQFYKALNSFSMISTNAEYDKALHYYYAECAYRLQDYATALNQYTKLLEFKSDKFFVTTSIRLIEHKQELARRFVTQFEDK